MDVSQQLELVKKRLDQLPQQKISNSIAMLLLIYAAYMVSGYVWQLFDIDNNKGKITAKSVAATSSQNSNNSGFENFSSFLAAEPFGKKEASAPKPKITKPINQPAPETRLNLTLVGLVADNNDFASATSVAIIESKGGQDLYSIGDKISGTSASVQQIQADRVILAVSGRFETLMMDGVEYSTKIPGQEKAEIQQVSKAKSQAPRPAVTSSRAMQKKKEMLDKRQDVELAQQLRQQRENLFEDPKKLLDVIRIKPFRQEGELKGYRLSPGKDPKLFKSVGLKRNDLAVSINGYDLTDMQQALTVMKELKAMTDATITVVRNDVEIDIMLAL